MTDLANFIGVVLGAASAAGLRSGWPIGLTALLIAVIPLAHCVALLLRTAGKAKLHHDVANDFIRLEVKIVQALDPGEGHLAEWQAGRLEIETREPPRLKALKLPMHNELCLATGREVFVHRMEFIWRLLKNLFDIKPDDIVRSMPDRKAEAHERSVGLAS